MVTTSNNFYYYACQIFSELTYLGLAGGGGNNPAPDGVILTDDDLSTPGVVSASVSASDGSSDT